MPIKPTTKYSGVFDFAHSFSGDNPFTLLLYVLASGAGLAPTPNGGADLDNADLVSWLNCECFFSLVLVGLLAALPFNLHTQELMQTPETYVTRAMELSEEGAFDKVLSTAVWCAFELQYPSRHSISSWPSLLGVFGATA